MQSLHLVLGREWKQGQPPWQVTEHSSRDKLITYTRKLVRYVLRRDELCNRRLHRRYGWGLELLDCPRHADRLVLNVRACIAVNGSGLGPELLDCSRHVGGPAAP